MSDTTKGAPAQKPHAGQHAKHKCVPWRGRGGDIGRCVHCGKSGQDQGEPVAWMARAIDSDGTTYRQCVSSNKLTERDARFAWGEGVLNRCKVEITPLGPHADPGEVERLRARVEELETRSAGAWTIDHSAGRPILMYENCSVIEDATAYEVIRMIGEVELLIAERDTMRTLLALMCADPDSGLSSEYRNKARAALERKS